MEKLIDKIYGNEGKSCLKLQTFVTITFPWFGLDAFEVMIKFENLLNHQIFRESKFSIKTAVAKSWLSIP